MNASLHGQVSIRGESDIVTTRMTVRDLATRLEFCITDVTRIVTAASELARNVFVYAGSGTMSWSRLDKNGTVGIELKFEDNGPGIPDVEQAMTRGYSTSRGLGLGLPGAQRLMDEMEVHSVVERGTTVTVRKWLRK
jgi:serine/threonine-protein kinase RsbT